MPTIDFLPTSSPLTARLNSPGRSILITLLAAFLMLIGFPARAEKTISYYTENVGERIDRVLACKDGAEDPASLGCRNASTAQEMDVQLTARFYQKIELKKWQAESNPNKAERQVIVAMQTVHNPAHSGSCANLIDGKEPTDAFVKAILKAVLEEKFVEPIPKQSGKYRVTLRGEEYLRALGQTGKTGMFCPTALQYVPEVKILQFQDLTAQYKGKTNPAGDTLKAVSVARVSFDLANPSASTWFSKKLSSSPRPAKGSAIAEYVIVSFSSKPGTVAAGAVLSIDGQPKTKFSADEFLTRFK